jgi:hypothetical protein
MVEKRWYGVKARAGGWKMLLGARRWAPGLGDACRARKRGQGLENASRGSEMRAGAWKCAVGLGNGCGGLGSDSQRLTKTQYSK